MKKKKTLFNVHTLQMQMHTILYIYPNRWNEQKNKRIGAGPIGLANAISKEEENKRIKEKEKEKDTRTARRQSRL